MSNSESSQRSSSGGGNRRSGGQRNRSRNRSRGGGGGGGNRGASSNREGSRRGGNSGGGGGGGGSRRFVKQKVPRRTKPPTLWEKILSFFGMGGAPKVKMPQSAEAPPQPERVQRRQEAKAKTAKERQPRKNAKPRTARPPEVVEVVTARLYVGNLSYDTTGDDLETLFADVAPVAMAEVVAHQRNQRSKGYGFVEMETVEAAKRAVDQLHDKDFMGRQIVVSGAKSAGPKSDQD